MPLPLILCPACGSDQVDALIGTSYQCRNCAHWFRVVNGQTQPDEDEDDDDDAAE